MSNKTTGWEALAASMDLQTAQVMAETIVSRLARLGPQGAQHLHQIVAQAELAIKMNERQPPERYHAARR